MATVNPSFGKVNDVFNAITGISVAILAWMLYAEHHARSPLMSQVGLALVVAGAIFTIVGSVLIIFDFTGFVLAGWYTGVGDALIGLWLILFCYAMRSAEVFPHNLITFGLVTGVIMAAGLLDGFGIFAGIDSLDSLPWYLNVGYLGYLGIYILYPIWTIWFGRNLLLH